MKASPLAALCLAMASLLPAAAPAPAPAQEARYELGRRLRAFEHAWDQPAPPESRARAVRLMNQAVSAFFAFRLSDAARSIDAARLALESPDPPQPLRLAAEALRLAPNARLLDPASGPLALSLAPLYQSELPPGARLSLEVSLPLNTPDNTTLKTSAPITELPLNITLEWPSSPPEADLILESRILDRDAPLASARQTLSIVPRLRERLEALDRAIANWDADDQPDSTEQASARALLRQLKLLAEGKTLETDFPAARWIRDLESLVPLASQNLPFFTPDRPGQHWITLRTRAGKLAPARIFVPDHLIPGQKTPLVVALHGAGGTENMFFEAYGHGRIVDLCRDRGWILLAPRAVSINAPSTAELVAALAERYPVDPGRVLLIGHSMGAAQAVAAARSNPDAFTAVAALGGGGNARGAAGLNQLPFFVAVGTLDFALQGARRLRDDLQSAGARRLAYREYPDIEHLLIIQVALNDVFAFFEQALANPRPLPTATTTTTEPPAPTPAP